ncbi:hypothetical protein [Butyrivibrio fibrisolvens]|uniref:hypothetical protein n=1 Tax=Butyrivibrio fibrisolvens TaxID=831 RepID=UPI0003B4BB85|nr:hypothetical protein [Butyrivibrio fibrisolvens]
MKIKKIFVLALSMAMLTGCTSSVIELGDDTDENNDDNISQEENDNLNSSNSSDEKDSKADSESSSSDQDDNDDTLWDSPMAEYVPESPYPYFISFVNGEIATKSDDYYFSDYISGDYKFTCCDLSGDGIAELVLLTQKDDEERLLVFSYDSDKGIISNSIACSFNSDCDYISRNGFVLLNSYEDESGNRYSGKTDDESYTQKISAILSTGSSIKGCSLFEWQRDAGSSEYDGPSEDVYDQIMEMASDQVVLSEGVKPEDMIPYLEECEKGFDDSIEEFKLFKQNGNGIFCNLGSADLPDNEYEDADEAYEAFINNETTVRCEYGIKAYDTYFSYIYGEKYALSRWYDSDDSDTLEPRYIDCGDDGSKELLISVTEELNYEPIESIYVISFYEGHLYLRFVTESSSRSYVSVGDDGCIYGGGSASDSVEIRDEAFLDSDIIFHYIYQLEMVSGEALKSYFPSVNDEPEELLTIYIYTIDGEEYYVPYYNFEEVTDEGEYTDFMKACEEQGISFSSQEDIDELIEE